MIKKLYLIHPFLFAILSAIFLWGQNFGEVPLREILPTFIVLIVFGGLVLFFSWIFFRDFEKSAIISSIFLVITLSFDYIYNIFFYNSFIQMRWRWTFFILFIIFIILIFLIKKTKKDLVNINKAMAIAIGTFILISFFQIVAGYYTADMNVQNENTKIVINDKTNQFRDIYYIILDGYPSFDVVKNVMGFEGIDQTASSLKEKGFFIADKSKSNYTRTLFSLSSSLNINYLQNPSANKRHFMLAEDHRVKDFLKSYGYKYFHFGADAFTYFNRYADENINLGLFSPYQTAVWHSTLFKPVQNLLGSKFDIFTNKFEFLDRRLIQWERERFKLQKLAEISNEKNSPVFAFAHFLIPKGAYVFDENGNFLTEEDSNKRGAIKNYLGQIMYINKEIENLVDMLLKNSNPEPIIIIQGDHSFPFYDNLNLIEEFAQPDLAKELIVPDEYSFPILNAYYFPEEGDKLLYDSITPVNTFRILFNYYFGQDFILLDDINYTPDPNNDSRFISWDK